MKSEKISLYLKQGSSDKVYKAFLEETDDHNFVAHFAYGRCRATQKTVPKTKAPLDYDAAKKIYDKLVKSKTSKGYVPGEDGSQYVHTDADMRDTGVQCQLLNFIEEAEVRHLINDDDWWAQEKYDGKRMLVQKTDTVTAINRAGLCVGASDVVISSAAQVEPTYLLDGEAVGETLFAFDLLALNKTDIRPEPYGQRLSHLENLGFGTAIVVVETAKTNVQKQGLYERLESEGGQGIVFKKHAASYTAGRPDSGSTQVKFKFYATASVIVTKINDKRSVAVVVINGADQIDVGKITIPPNKDVPAVNAIVEVRYLYAYQGGSLYQPTYIGERDDLSLADCRRSQLKYKQETA